MATVSPSPDSAPAAISPTSSLTPPQLSTPPQASTQVDPSTPSPSVPSTQVTQQLDANPPDSSAPSPPSSPPDAPAPSGSGTPVITSPVDSSPPPTASVPPPSPSTFPPPTLVLPPTPSNPSPPPSSDVAPPPPQTGPPVSSSPATKSPPPLPSPNPPTSSPPLAVPPTSFPPPPPASPPPISSTTPPSSTPLPAPPAFETPEFSPPPPSSKPPENSPPSSSIGPPRRSPPAPASHAPQSSPSAPAVETPRTSQPSTGRPPPPGSVFGSPPVTPVTPSPPVSHSSPSSSFGPPLSDPQRAAQSSHNLPAQDSSSAKGNSNGGVSSGGAAAIAVVAAVLTIGLIGFIALWITKRKKRKSGANDAYIMPASLGSSPGSGVKLVVKTEYPSPPFGGGSTSDPPTDPGGFGRSKPWFTYEELFEATGGFSSQNLLGEGGFGYVYKGFLADGREVAVKQLKIGGGQGEREFQAEVEIISRIHHRHLVSLVGYCISKSKRLLVYDYVPNNTLYFHLHGEGRPTIDWSTRVKIAAGAARGIAYLHEDCHPRVIHRDIKSSNILLDNNFEAQVADFGLAKLAMDADTHVSTRVMGTFGYMAPEYATSGKLTEKSDVYSFGVVLLELITGRKPVDESQPLGDESVVEWARPLLTRALDTGDYEGLVDPRLERNYIESEMFRMIEAAAACVRHSSSKRPRMGQIVRALDGLSDSGDLSNGLRVGESRLYDPAQQSAEIRWFRRLAFGSQDISSEFFNQSHSYSVQGGHTANFSGQHGLSGDISRQHNQTAHNLGFSRQDMQNANISAGGISTPQHNSVFSDQDSRKI